MPATLHEAGPRRRARWPRAAVAALFAAALAVSAAAGGCGGGEPSGRAAAIQQQRSQKLIDAGNEAYRIGDYRLAARRYAAAAVIRKDDPAAYFGMGMALSKLGRDEEARVAYQRARDLARTQSVLGFPGTAAAPDTIPPAP